MSPTTGSRVSPMETLEPPSTPPRRRRHQISVLLITFSAYASFHVSRKPPSIVKSLLGPEISSPSPTSALVSASGWPPFDGPRGPHRLGELDLAFLSAYAAGMFFAGHAGDRLDLRRLLAFGMLGSGIATAAFGLGFWLRIHRLGFYLTVQIVGGLFQSIGWPCVVAVMGNWFGKSKRGFIMGVWNSNSSVGNIVGSVIASSVLEFGWGWSFILPAILIVVLGIVVFLFLVVDPSDLEFESISTEIEMGEAGVGPFENGSVVSSDVNGEEIGLLRAGVSSDSDVMHAIGFVEAWRLPGVAQFAFCLFFSKLVGYTFLYWLPFYIRHTAIAGEHLSYKTAGILSAVFDVGGVFGGISAGIISDRLGARATTSCSFLLLSIPTLVLYRIYGSMSMYFNIGLMFLSGYSVNGPYSLITTAVAADLGTQDTISGNSRALATVTAILEGTGSIGAALGPLLTGYISTRGWNSVFAMLDELEEREKRIGQWSTSFPLSGKAKGATLNVSFGFSCVGDGSGFDMPGGGGEKKVAEVSNLRPGRGRGGGVPRRGRSRSVEDWKGLQGALRSSRSEVPDVYTELEQQKLGDKEVDTIGANMKPPELEDVIQQEGNENKDFDEQLEFMVIEQGIEVGSAKVELDGVDNGGKLAIPSAKPDEPLGDFSFGDNSLRQGGELVIQSELSVKLDEPLGDLSFRDDRLGQNNEDQGPALGELSFRNDGLRLNSEDLDSALGDLSFLDVDSPIVKPRIIDSSTPRQICKPGSMMSRSLSLDGSTDSVENEFLSMLGLDHSSEDSPFRLSSGSDPDSPRERLWKQFKKETSATGDGIFGFDQDPGWGVYLEDPDLSSIVDEAETELQKAAQYMDSKSRVKMLEDAETEALMRDWGLNEEAFRSSPPENMSGFGSPIYIPPEEPLELPPLGEGLGPFLQTKDGGFVRSMNPSLFKNAKNKGSLIMQVSSPVVVPAEMGSGVMEILQQLASVGIEKLSMQAKKLMPLEDISGMTMQQASWEAAPEEYERETTLDTDSGVGQNSFGGKKKAKRPNLSSPSSGEMSSEYVSLEELAPLAMDKIETLSIEGLRIQSGMSGEEAPSTINPQSSHDILAWKGEESNNIRTLGVDGAAGLQLMDVKDNVDDVDGLMGLSITLDEWMRLDSGIVDDDQISDRTSKILAAHHACSTDFVTAGKKGDKRGGKRSGKRWGLLGNNFTVVLMVQLRDPLRDYEPVGTPMLALVQVERVFVPPKPKIYSTISEQGNSEHEDESETKTEQSSKEEEKEENGVVPRFKITEVHVAGPKTEPDKKKIWGNPIQQQSGSRWLLASGMGKNNKTPFMKSKSVKPSSVTAAVQPRDNLWSISSRIQGAVSKWKGLASLNPHIRNPNVILPN